MRRLPHLSVVLVLLVGILCSPLPAAVPPPTKITSPDPSSVDQFGGDVDVDGDTMVIGVPRDDDNGEIDSGSAYVYSWDAVTGWVMVTKLVPADLGPEDLFGFQVAIDGDTIAVSASAHDGLAPDAGAVYVFERNVGGPDSWGMTVKLQAPAFQASGDRFGTGLAIDGDTIVVGSRFEDAVGIDSGAAYVFERDFGGVEAWGQAARLLPSSLGAGAQFGFSACIDGDDAVIGAITQSNTGAAFVYQRSAPATWSEVTELTASDATSGDDFGKSVTIEGGVIVVGANYVAGDTGAAYVFAPDPLAVAGWTEIQKLEASDGLAGDLFGGRVVLRGDLLAIGAQGRDGGVGAVYLFRWIASAASWVEYVALLAGDGGAEDEFGGGLGLSGGTLSVGALKNAANGFQNGAAYVFDVTGIPCFIRGDSNGDGSLDLADAIHVLGYIFTGGAADCLRASDANADAGVDIADAIFVLNYLFQQSTPPPAPFPGCGLDPTASGLSCDAFPACP